MSGDKRKWRLLALFSCVALATGCGVDSGCEGGGIDGLIPGVDGGGPGESPKAQSLKAYKDDINADEAWHLLRRAAFGGTPERVQEVVNLGLTQAVEDLIATKPEPAAVTTLADTYESNMPKRWLVHMVEGPNPLHERMAMFWHDRFATSRRVVSGADDALAVLHWQMLRANALGNYKEFLEALTLDPLMLVWLDGGNSPKDNPNENYAREFWELFTLGRDVLYTEDDIKEGARAFTGTLLIRDNGEPRRPVFDIFKHDETPKSIFPGRAAPENYNYETVIDLTLAQPEAAQYVARNLFKCFVHDHPTDATVQALADMFVESGFEIEPLVRTLLQSEAFFSEDARNNQIASPVEHWVGFARTLDMHMSSEDSQGFLLDRLVNDLRDAGQELMNPPGVEGWAEDDAWLEDQWVLNRVDALGRFMDFGPNRTAGLPYHLLPDVSQWDQRDVREQMVNAIADVFHLTLSEDEVAIYVEVLDQNGYLAFHLEDPERQPQHVREMIRLMAMDERVAGR
ncbi:MAG: DUF1800 domain-containing protein [Phycisphaerales bacterium]|nr:DUF1800 domain-containing protein [Phycisphaerales bacterium]MCB9855251.1 DUF1800 domain-containing protein [Phycisphaerales bacterium]MCB9862844.1 DUF1800 domain-containing protein [Phycisphaerales bacterium]